MRFLLDTNAVIAWRVRQDHALVTRLQRHSDDVALSVMVIHELYYGAFNSDRLDRNLAQIAEIRLPILSFTDDDARAAGEVRARLRRQGTPIGPFDGLIAGQALARDLILVTNNTREFARVAGLRVEDWTTG